MAYIWIVLVFAGLAMACVGALVAASSGAMQEQGKDGTVRISVALAFIAVSSMCMFFAGVAYAG